MCGIAGIWNYKSGSPADRGRLTTMTNLIAHRGPDGEGFYWGPGPGLGHRRLSIIDLEGGHQPMCNEDGTIWIVFNGEIYNFPELRGQLEERGHKFHTRSDTEAIVHLYEDYSDNCFEKLRGMFALALWDQRRRRLVLARDRLGIKPLFYGIGRGGIAFGSELKCVRASGAIDLEIEPTAIADLFTWFYIPGPKTIYRNAFSLEPGHCLVVTEDGLHKKKYWDLTAGPLEHENRSEEDCAGRLHELLRGSVRCHLLSDVPVGAFLSGGVDSSAIVALMANEAVSTQPPVSTYSIGFAEEEYNELPRAQAVANLFHTNHHQQVVTPEPAKILERLIHFYDQPFPDHSAMPTFYVSQLARQKVKVVLSGDGGDENFGGYSRYLRQRALENIRRSIPGILRNPALYPFRFLPGDRWNNSLPARLQRVAHQLAIGARDAYLHGITIADAPMRARLFSEDLQKQLAGYDPLDSFREIYDRAPGSDPLSKIFYLDLKTYLVDDILTKVDRASMANSLEVRVPLLDHKVVEFAYSLPLEMKLRGDQRKYLLKKVLAQYLPEDHLNLQKKGFRVPMTPWMRGGLQQWTNDILSTHSQASEFLNPRAVRQVWHSFQRGQSHFADMLSIMLSFLLSSPAWAPP
ncbi:MAG TPA: asparagine synthase (glutamine-hydrolyzing), partial [Candidatus Binatia bacterium]|nr:asparagine synthase (glutamine-hydrolyzing) [Candidatus Binatia bacterium]